MGEAIIIWEWTDLCVARTNPPFSLRHLNSDQIRALAWKHRKDEFNVELNPAVKAQVDLLLYRFPPGYAAERYREEEEEGAKALKWDEEWEQASRENKPWLLKDRRHFLPIADSMGFLHDASCAGFASWTSVVLNSHGHTDHGKAMMSRALVDAVQKNDVAFFCQVSFLGMGQLPLDKVVGIPYYTETQVPGSPGVADFYDTRVYWGWGIVEMRWTAS